MQTTLLGLAIAIILALVAALVGPSFIDWNQYRPEFEAEASRVIGAPVRVEGSLDARLLPAPILRLRSLSIGAPGDATRMHADKLDVEFSLGSLMRGEWRAAQLSLAGVALNLGLDARGAVVAPSRGEFNFGALAIDRLDLTGSVKVHDEASGADYALKNISFNGDVRALGSNMRGDGTVIVGGSKQPFRLSVSQAADGDGTRVRVDLDPATQGAIATSIDGTLTFDRRMPRFEGITTLVKQTERPWRVSAKTKATPSGAAFEQAELVYGADNTGLKFAGGGSIAFGKTPRLIVSLTAQQLDADRALPDDMKSQSLIDLVRSGLESGFSVPIASEVEIKVDRLLLAGRPVSNLKATLRGSSDAWTVEKFSCLAPGTTTVSLNGVVKSAAKGFTGPLRIDAKAGKTFFDWVYRRGNDFVANDVPVQIAALVSVSKNTLTLENIKGDLNGSAVTGGLSLGERSIKLALTSPSFDFADAQALIDTGKLALPETAQVSLNFKEAKIGSRSLQPFVIDASYKSNGQPTLSKASVDLNVRRADLTPWLGASQTLSDLTGKLVIADNKFTLEKFAGKLGERSVKGSLSLTRTADAADVSGDLFVDKLDAAPLLGAALGASGQDASAPLGTGWFGSRGVIAVKTDVMTLPDSLTLTTASGTLRVDGTALSLDNLKGAFGNGSLTASVHARRDTSGTHVNADIKVSDAEGAALTYRALSLPAERASLRMTLASEGRSVTGLTNALSGNGILTLNKVSLAALNPAVFDTTVKAADETPKTDVGRLAVATLDKAALTVPSLEVPFAINDARLHVDPVTVDADNMRATISGGYDLPADQIDIRTSLRSTTLKASPEIQIFSHGTPDALTRDVDTSLLSSWLSLREIERETKRLDDLEKDSKLSVTPTVVPPAVLAPAAAPQPAPAPVSVPQPVARPAVPAEPQAEPRKSRAAPKPVVRTPAASPNVATSGERLAPLPPPIDIRPAPGIAPARRPASSLPTPGTTF